MQGFERAVKHLDEKSKKTVLRNLFAIIKKEPAGLLQSRCIDALKYFEEFAEDIWSFYLGNPEVFYNGESKDSSTYPKEFDHFILVLLSSYAPAIPTVREAMIEQYYLLAVNLASSDGDWIARNAHHVDERCYGGVILKLGTFKRRKTFISNLTSIKNADHLLELWIWRKIEKAEELKEMIREKVER